MEEIDDCSEPKLSYLQEQMELIDYALLEKTEEVIKLAERYATEVLKKKSFAAYDKAILIQRLKPLDENRFIVTPFTANALSV
ncbi:MAG: hypothetical protein LBJ36_00195 [Synergistaceae bacterium]|jgi:hypothetical protein|nr:hypothetical protein [Synergistaceae bacterium]